MTTDLFAGINDGDKIRVEYGEYAVEGLWTRRSGTGWSNCIGTIEGVLGDHLGAPLTCHHIYLLYSHPVTRVTVLRRALPPEPPNGSVVLVTCENGNKRSYQRVGDKWCCWLGFYCSWAQLNEYFGPVRVLWTPEEGE